MYYFHFTNRVNNKRFVGGKHGARGMLLHAEQGKHADMIREKYRGRAYVMSGSSTWIATVTDQVRSRAYY